MIKPAIHPTPAISNPARGSAVSKRRAAWRNLVVAAAGEAIARGVLRRDATQRVEATTFPFEIGGRQALGFVGGNNEVTVHAILEPTPEVFKGDFIASSNLCDFRKYFGAAIAIGWLGRKGGLHLRTGKRPGVFGAFSGDTEAKDFLCAQRVEPAV